MTSAERWNRACRILGALGGSAVVRVYKSGGCAVDVHFRNRIEGGLGQIRVTSKPGKVGQGALDHVTDECSEAIEKQAQLVRAELGALLPGAEGGAR